MTDLTPDQIAEREAARRRNGEFGEHDHSAPELALGNAFRDAAYPFTVRVNLEHWDGRRYVTLRTVEFDARALLDARPLRDLHRLEEDDLDWIFEEAVRRGLTDEFDGPYTVELPDDVADYIEHRETSGMTDAYPNADEIIAAAALDANMERRAKALEDAQRYLEAAGPGAIETKKVSELNSGDILVQGTNRLRIEEQPGPTSLVPGFWSVGTHFGYLYLDPDETAQVEAL